jgi:hypothetical protein
MDFERADPPLFFRLIVIPTFEKMAKGAIPTPWSTDHVFTQFNTFREAEIHACGDIVDIGSECCRTRLQGYRQ